MFSVQMQRRPPVMPNSAGGSVVQDIARVREGTDKPRATAPAHRWQEAGW